MKRADKVIIIKLYYNLKENFNHSKESKKKLRKKDISQDELSKLTNITPHTITKIESGTTSDLRIETDKKIADALNICIDDLLKL